MVGLASGHRFCWLSRWCRCVKSAKGIIAYAAYCLNASGILHRRNRCILDTATHAGALSNTAPANYKNLGTSLDWLTVNITEPFPEGRLLEMYRLVEESPSANIETAYSYLDTPLVLQRGRSGAVVTLHSDLLDISIQAPNSDKPSKVTIYSPALWSFGNDLAVSQMQGFVDTLWCQHCTLIPSRLDLCCDVTGFPVSQFDSRRDTRSRLVTRSKKLDFLGEADTQTLRIGRASSAVQTQIYNKTADCMAKGKDYYFATWQARGWLGLASEEVTRVEFRCSREFFNEWHTLGEDGNAAPILDVWDMLDALPAIWQYLTRKHCRIVVPDAAELNRTRLQDAAVWLVVSEQWDGSTVASPGTRYTRRSHDRDRLDMQGTGVLRSRLALTPDAEDMGDMQIAGIVLGLITDDLSRRNLTWREYILQRRTEIMGRRRAA